ncbi:MAG: 4Fe-4S binding protein [Candidatus Altarchaeaceae archaeon]
MEFTIGAVIKEPGNSIRNKTSGWRIRKPIVDEKKCVKCGLCAIFCPEGIIEIKNFAEIDYDYCKGCGICAHECPKKAITMIPESK